MNGKKKKKYVPSYSNPKKGLLSRFRFWKTKKYKPSYYGLKKNNDFYPSYNEENGSKLSSYYFDYYFCYKFLFWVGIPLLIVVLLFSLFFVFE